MAAEYWRAYAEILGPVITPEGPDNTPLLNALHDAVINIAKAAKVNFPHAFKTSAMDMILVFFLQEIGELPLLKQVLSLSRRVCGWVCVWV
jgi:polyferredoxin